MGLTKTGFHRDRVATHFLEIEFVVFYLLAIFKYVCQFLDLIQISGTQNSRSSFITVFNPKLESSASFAPK